MPSRVIRSGLLDSESLAGLHDRTFRLYIHLLLSADDYGLVEIGYGPIKRSAALLDWSREIVAKMLAELIDAELILPYEVDRKCYAAITKWQAAIQARKPKHPMPPFGMSHVRAVYARQSTRVDEIAKHLPHINLKTSEKTTGEEKTELLQSAPELLQRGSGATEERGTRNEESRATRPASGTRLPLDWTPPAELLSWAKKERPDLDLRVTVENFRDYWLAATGKGATKRDWDAAFRVWVRNEKPGRGDERPTSGRGRVVI